MSKVKVNTRITAYWQDALEDVRYVSSQHDNGVEWADMVEIRDDTALAIASAWASPGTVGCYLAELATTGEVERGNLLRDISNTLQSVTNSEDRNALGCLATWTMNRA